MAVVRHRDAPGRPELGVVVPRRDLATATLGRIGALRQAALGNDLTGAPAKRGVAARRLGAEDDAIFHRRLAPGPVLLRVAMSRHDLEQALLFGVHVRRELLVEVRRRRRIEAPGRAVRDEQVREPLGLEPVDEVLGGRGVLVTVLGQLVRGHLVIAVRHLGDLLEKASKVVVDLPVGEIEQRDDRRDDLRVVAQGRGRQARSADGAGRDVGIAEALEDDVLVAVVVVRVGADLRPLETHHRDQVGLVGVEVAGVAVAHRGDRLGPLLRRHRLGVVGERPEVDL